MNKMTFDTEILKLINDSKKNFGPKCGKYTGALTVEVIKSIIKEIPLNVSSRDCFIRGVPIEFDLIIAASGIVPVNNVLYEPDDVIGVIEVKNYGSFGEKTIQKLKKDYEAVISSCKNATCYYITLAERVGFRWAVTKMNTGYESYTLFNHRGKKYYSTGAWDRFINDLRRK
jgi:hypothetical protein